MTEKKPSHEELQARLERAEAVLAALRRGEVDMLLGARDPLVVRLKSLADENERLVREWQTTFDNVNDAIWLLDAEHRIQRSNRTAERFFGKVREEFIGRRCWEIVHGTQEPIPECPLLRLRESLRREILELPIGDRWFEVTVDPVLDGNGNYSGAVHMVSDITERKRLEEWRRASEENFRRFLDGLPLGARVVSEEGDTLYANRAFLDMHGCDSVEEFQNIPSRERYTPAAHTEHLSRREKRRRGEYVPPEYEISIVRKDGAIRHLHVQRDEILWDGKRHFQVLYRDITERKRMEEERDRVFQRLRETLGTTMKVAVRVVEMRDPYTAGHQRRVADIARAIAVEMSLPAEQIDGLRYAASVHDLGKVAVPADILTKPSVLTAPERALIQIHSQTGYDILKDIDFPWPIARMVLEHHERIDGTGYPNGLSGEKLLMESRILAVADVVEAMALHRPYRPALGLDAALQEIEAGRGRLYDAKVADICLRLFREKGYILI